MRLFLALLILVSLAPLLSHAAPIDDVLSVRSIDVDVTAKSAADAKAEALRKAQEEGFVTIVRRTVLAADQKRVPTPDAATLERFVRDFEVVSEKTSDVRYIGVFNIRYRPAPFFDHLGRLGVRYAETVSKPLVVVPLLVTSDGGRLWDAPNPWLNTWQDLNLPPTLAPVTVPYGELPDVQDVSVTQAAQGDAKALAALSARYNAKGALVVIYRQLTADEASVTMRQIGGAGQIRPQTLKVSLQQGESASLLYVRAISATLVALEEAWRSGNSIDPTIANEDMSLAIPVRAISDWNDLRRRLGNAGPIRSIELKSFSTSRYMVDISYGGSRDALITALRQQGLVLAPVSMDEMTGQPIADHELVRLR